MRFNFPVSNFKLQSKKKVKAPPVANTINSSSLPPGCVTDFLKTFFVQQIIEKAGIDPSHCGDYRPILN